MMETRWRKQATRVSIEVQPVNRGERIAGRARATRCVWGKDHAVAVGAVGARVVALPSGRHTGDFLNFCKVCARRSRGVELGVFRQRLQAVMELRRQCLRVNFVVREVDLLWQTDFVFSGECMR